jgi:Domain of unknown function (DUF4406)
LEKLRSGNLEAEMKSYYLAGPMQGYPEHNFPAFEAAAIWLRGQGATVLGAHEVDHGETHGTHGTTKTHGEYLRKDLQVLLQCDAIVLLPGWVDSKGAMIEFQTAIGCGLDVLLYSEDLPDRLLRVRSRND